jgi:hypothetical protein
VAVSSVRLARTGAIANVAANVLVASMLGHIAKTALPALLGHSRRQGRAQLPAPPPSPHPAQATNADPTAPAPPSIPILIVLLTLLVCTWLLTRGRDETSQGTAGTAGSDAHDLDALSPRLSAPLTHDVSTGLATTPANVLRARTTNVDSTAATFAHDASATKPAGQFAPAASPTLPRRSKHAPEPPPCRKHSTPPASPTSPATRAPAPAPSAPAPAHAGSRSPAAGVKSSHVQAAVLNLALNASAPLSPLRRTWTPADARSGWQQSRQDERRRDSSEGCGTPYAGVAPRCGEHGTVEEHLRI